MSKKMDNMWAIKILLPEHKVDINNQERDQLKKKKPVLDEQELEIIYRAIGESRSTGIEIQFVLFEEYIDRIVTGVVSRVDQYRRVIRIEHDDDFEWLKIDDILKVHQ